MFVSAMATSATEVTPTAGLAACTGTVQPGIGFDPERSLPFIENGFEFGALYTGVGLSKVNGEGKLRFSVFIEVVYWTMRWLPVGVTASAVTSKTWNGVEPTGTWSPRNCCVPS